MIIIYFVLGCLALNIIVPLLWFLFDSGGGHGVDCDCEDCPYEDDRKERIRQSQPSSSKSSSSSSSSKSYNPNSPAWSATPPPNLDHWYYG